MGHQNEPMTTLVVEKVREEGINDILPKHPMVLSCGGIFIPRQENKNPNNAIYKILNIANEKEPIKIVENGMLRNMLQEILHKESLN